MATFGVNASDGTLAPCRAKPENRGRGSCFHEDHVELDGPMAAPETIRAYNEEKLAAHFQSTALTSLKRTMTPKPPTPAAVAHRHSAGALTRQEFHDATEGIADAFPDGAWEMLNGFYANFSSLVEEEEKLRHSRGQTIRRVQRYLESNSPTARKVRAYLGPEVSPADFSAILVNDVRSMTARAELQNSLKSDSVNRVMLTSVANDMTKRRYVASVLFFAGRCCYCRTPMSKEKGEHQATGEHLTPLNPENASAPPGATRYGNMALACYGCNHERKNKDLQAWVSETKRIPAEEKDAVVKNIGEFRRFTLYEEFTPKQSELIRSTVKHMQNARQALPKVHGVAPPKEFQGFSRRLKATTHDLATQLQHSD